MFQAQNYSHLLLIIPAHEPKQGTRNISISKFAQGLEGRHTTFECSTGALAQGQNTAIYRTGAIWASKWPLGPAWVLLACPAGPFGPVSGLPGRSKCRSVTHQNSAIYPTGATWASKWPLGPAWVLLECPAGPFGPVSALPGRSKCRSVTHQNSAIYRTGATWPSKWLVGPA